MISSHKTIDDYIHLFNESAFGEIDIILENRGSDVTWMDDKDSVMREIHESACNCLDIAEYLEQAKNNKGKSWLRKMLTR